MSVDFEAEGLLDGLEEDGAREARLDLLRQLHEQGFTLEELKQAVKDERLPMLPVERVLGGEGKYSRREIAEKVGLPLEVVEEQRRAVGLPRADPDARDQTERDLQAIEELKQFLDAGMPYDKITEVTRVIGEAMARVASAASLAVGESFIQAGDTERDLGLRYAEAAKHLRPVLGKQMDYVLDLHFTEQVRNYVIYQTEMAAGELEGAQDVTVCFADLVGFTKLGERVAPEEVGRVARQLGEMASDVLVKPVRLVKTIGDAAMLASQETEPMVETVLALLDEADAAGEEFPAIHAGIASGQGLPRAGDWYGQPVNLASRVTDIARPGSALATGDVKKAVGDGYSWSAAGRRRVKGVKEPVSLFRVRRGE